MFPELFDIGPFHLRTYGLMLAVGFLAGAWLALRDARRAGLDPDRLLSLLVLVLIAGILGARASYVMGHLDLYRARPAAALAVWEGGLTLWGGFLVAVPLGLWYTHRHGMRPWTVADVLAAPVALAASFGRVGCFLNGCCYGKPTTRPWGIVFPEGSDAARHFPGEAIHPSQLYNVLAGLVVFAVVLVAGRFLRAPGQRWWLFMGLYALLRVAIDTTRYYDPSTIWLRWQGGQLTESQVIGLGIALFSAAAFLWLGRRYERQRSAARAADPAA